LFVLVSVYSADVYAIAPEGSWWNASYGYRQRIDLPAGTASLASGYAVSFVFDHAAAVGAGRSLASGDDVRVAYWNGAVWTELDRILDPATTWNSATTRIWFKTQALIASGVTIDNYYVYFGNAAAGAPPASSANIYMLYDEFNGTTLNTALWASTGPSPVIISGGILSCPNSCQLESVASYGVDTIWEARVSLSSTSGSTFYYWLASDAGNFNGRYIGFSLTGGGSHTGSTRNAGTITTRTVTASAANTYRNYAFTREGTTAVRFYVNGTQQGTTVTTNIPTVNLPVIVRDTAGPGTSQNYDWVRVRPYRTNEPTLTLAGQEQLAPVAQYRFDETTWNGTNGEVADSSASNLDGVALSGPITSNSTPAVSGNPGTCRYGVFDGSNDYVQVADNSALDISAALTVSAWVYPRAYGTELKAIVSKDTNFEFHLDDNGEVYWWWHDDAGTTRSVTSTGFAVPLNQWTHVTVTYRSGSQRIYINGVQRASATFTGALDVNGLALQIGYDGAGSAQPLRYWNGYIDEVNIYSTALSQPQVAALMSATHPCTGGAPHFVIGHDGYGINCVAETVNVGIRDSGNNPYVGYNQQITLNTGTSKGDWSLLSGAGTLSNGTANDGIATYQWAPTESGASFSLSYREGAATIDIDAYQTSDTTIRDDDTEGNMIWSPSGFTVTSSALANPPPGVIPAFVSPQIAGTNFTIHITAFGVTPTDAQCGVIEGYAGNKNLKFWSAYVNPSSGTINVTINGGVIQPTEAASTAQAVVFTNGQATVTAKYKDVGLINIGLKDDTTGNPSLISGVRGATGNFVSKPATITLSAITRTDGTVNAGPIVDQNSSVFLAAGVPFRTTVSVRDAENSLTPNFGLETPAESVGLSPTLVAPTGAGSNNPPVAKVGTHTYSGGQATNVNFSWSEVGIITLAPGIYDGDYLGSGNATGPSTGNIGRFIPYTFGVSQNVPSFQTACTAGSFTYVGQPFSYLVAPVITATALAQGGTTTRNYTGVFFKLTNTTLTGRAYSAVVGTLDTSGLPATSLDPIVADLTNGVATLTYGSGSGLSFSRTTPVAPFTAQISLSQNILDADGVAASNPVAFSNIAFSAGSQQSYGRIAFRNAVGSELLNLPLPMRAEYFQTTVAGFVTNTADTCTTGVSVTLGGYGGNLNAGETCVLDTGSPGVSGAGCSIAGPVGQRFQMPPAAGDFVAILRAPGAGNSGTVTAATVVPSWLRFDWNAAVPGLENPSGVAVFGIFQGESKRIFQTEK
jgi:hypothetical protein